jgi:hypothetical protein
MRDDQKDGKESPVHATPVALLLTQAKLLESRARDAERDALAHRDEAIALDKLATSLMLQADELHKAARLLIAKELVSDVE